MIPKARITSSKATVIRRIGSELPQEMVENVLEHSRQNSGKILAEIDRILATYGENSNEAQAAKLDTMLVAFELLDKLIED